MGRERATSFGARLKALREDAGYTQEELAAIAGLSVHAVSALERGERRRPHADTVRSLSAAFDLSGEARAALLASARAPAHDAAVDELSRSELPQPLTSILGRESDIETLRQWLGEPTARLITLVGPGGVGKTRLALELARAVHEQGATRVVFVPLAAVQESALVAPAVAETLGLAEVGEAELPGRVRAACADQSTLLVLDNCEHLPVVATLLADLLTAAASVRALATSREPLHVRGERQYAVGPLAVESATGAVSVSDAARAPAVRLFLERAREVQPEFRLTPSTTSVVTAICRRLDALPLALELAAPWIKVLTVEGLLDRLERDVLLSSVGPRDLPGRQQTMNATVAWSCQLMNAVERRAFRRLGAVPGRFSIEAAAAVLAGRDGTIQRDEALTAAATLIDKSLLQRADSTGSRPLYQMFQTVRACASLELATAGERDDTMEGLARHCTNEVSLAAEGLAGSAQSEWLDRIREELEIYRAVLAWLIERGRRADACDIGWGLGLFLLIRGHTTEGLHWYGQMLTGAALLPPVAEAKALVGAGLMHWAKGAFDQARSALRRATVLATNAAADDMVIHAESVLGHVESAAGNLDGARELYSRAVAGYRTLGLPWGVGTALNGMAGLALAAGDTDDAQRLLDEASHALRESGPWFLTPVLCFRAVLAIQRGEPDVTIALIQQSLTHIRSLQDKFAFVYALVPLALAAVLKGDPVWAARLLGARDAVAESTGAGIVDNAVQPLREHAEQQARAHLGPDGWARAYTAGRSASIDSLLKDIETARA